MEYYSRACGCAPARRQEDSRPTSANGCGGTAGSRLSRIRLRAVRTSGRNIEIPDHPLVKQTIRDCLEEAMDIEGLEALLNSIERGERTLIARDVVEASPLAQEILSARPYAYLDDAPLEERRTQAVFQRRWLDPETACDLGALDQGAIERVREEAWPQADRADELHDALVELGFVTPEEGADWEQYLGRARGGPPRGRLSHRRRRTELVGGCRATASAQRDLSATRRLSRRSSRPTCWPPLTGAWNPRWSRSFAGDWKVSVR